MHLEYPPGLNELESLWIGFSYPIEFSMYYGVGFVLGEVQMLTEDSSFLLPCLLHRSDGEKFKWWYVFVYCSFVKQTKKRYYPVDFEDLYNMIIPLLF